MSRFHWSAARTSRSSRRPWPPWPRSLRWIDGPFGELPKNKWADRPWFEVISDDHFFFFFEEASVFFLQALGEAFCEALARLMGLLPSTWSWPWRPRAELAKEKSPEISFFLLYDSCFLFFQDFCSSILIGPFLFERMLGRSCYFSLFWEKEQPKATEEPNSLILLISFVLFFWSNPTHSAHPHLSGTGRRSWSEEGSLRGMAVDFWVWY